MNYLIVYYSFTGNNKKLALMLKEKLACDIFEIKEQKQRSPLSILYDFMFFRKAKLVDYNINLNQYDYVILVSPIWAGRLSTPLKTFLKKQKDSIKKYSFITICGGIDGQKQGIISTLTSFTRTKPTQVTDIHINDFLPKDKQGNIKHIYNYRLTDVDLVKLENDIDFFISTLA